MPHGAETARVEGGGGVSATNTLQCAMPSAWASKFSQCLYEWQGVESGMLAVFAAVVGSILLWRQIRQSDRHRQNDIDRRHIAAKLTMPLALSSISEMTQSIAGEIASELETYGPEGFDRTIEAIQSGKAFRKRFDPAQVRQEVLGSFEKFVETMSNGNDIKHVSELISSLQILTSRFNDQDLLEVGAKTNLESRLLDVATVKVLSDRMFNYARNVDQESFGIVGVLSNNEAWDLIEGGAQSLVFARPSPNYFFPAIHETVSRYKEHNVSPWLEKFQ